MKKSVIVIGREYGSGARRIGRKVAERLNYTYYDKELLSSAADNYGLSQEFFDRADERKPSLWTSFFMPGVGVPETMGIGTLSGESPYVAQSEVIRSIGAEGRCVIVGRTADYILREHPAMLSIFMHAPVEHRAKAIVARGECKTEREALAQISRRDKSREEYYDYFTGRKWGKASNYDLTLNSSLLDDDQIVDIICRMAE